MSVCFAPGRPPDDTILQTAEGCRLDQEGDMLFDVCCDKCPKRALSLRAVVTNPDHAEDNVECQATVSEKDAGELHYGTCSIFLHKLSFFVI